MQAVLHDSLILNLARARRVISPAQGRSMFDADVLSLCSGEGLCRPHPAAVARATIALFETHRSSLDNYRYLRRHEALEELIRGLAAETGLPATHAGDVLVGHGVTRLLEAFIVAHTEPGSVSFLSCNHYHPLPKLFDLLQRRVILVPEAGTPGSGCIDAASLQAAIDTAHAVYGRNLRLGALLLFNPGYTGEVYAADVLQGLAAVLARHRFPVLEDAIFAGTEYTQRSARIASFLPPGHRAVTVSGVSKLFGMANARVGWALGDAAAIAPMSEFSLSTNPANFWVALEAARGALAARASYLPACARELATRAALVGELCEHLNRRAGERLLEPQRPAGAGHSVLLDAGGLTRRLDLELRSGGFDLSHVLLQTCGVAFSPAGSHGHPHGDSLRVCHASVGADATYEESCDAERIAIAPVLRLLAEGDHTGAARAADAIELQPWQAPVRGWRRGRAMLEEAFEARLLPWLMCSSRPRRAA